MVRRRVTWSPTTPALPSFFYSTPAKRQTDAPVASRGGFRSTDDEHASITIGRTLSLGILLCLLQIGPTPLSAAAQQPSGQAGRGERGGRGSGGLPPMNPIDENAPPPPLVTPGTLPGEPPSDAVVLFNGTDPSQWTLRDGSPAKCKVENRRWSAAPATRASSANRPTPARSCISNTPCRDMAASPRRHADGQVQGEQRRLPARELRNPDPGLGQQPHQDLPGRIERRRSIGSRHRSSTCPAARRVADLRHRHSRP